MQVSGEVLELLNLIDSKFAREGVELRLGVAHVLGGERDEKVEPGFRERDVVRPLVGLAVHVAEGVRHGREVVV